MIPSSSKTAARESLFLGVEGGATRSTVALMDGAGKVLRNFEAGPCNIRLLDDHAILRLWRSIRHRIGIRKVTGVGIFVAGCRLPEEHRRLARLARAVWPGTRAVTGNDTQSALAAGLGDEDGLAVICGTGSIVRARRSHRSIQVGGWGHVGGDGGGGYWMGRELLRHIFHQADLRGATDPLGRATLSFLGLNTLEDLVRWSLEASKSEVASLTHVIFKEPRHPVARQILREAASLVADQVVMAARRTGLRAPRVALNRGLARHSPVFRRLLMAAIHAHLPKADVFLSEVEGAVGAAWLATGRSALPSFEQPPDVPPPPAGRGLGVALTEQRNPRTMDLDRRSIPQLIRTMLDEERRVIPAIRREERAIARAIAWIVESLRHGGRLFYLGAGTSGRVGVLDASECPPTFGCPADMVQGIMAGGWRALDRPMESREDDAETGRDTVRDRGIGRRDVLVGIAASGSTPFVLGALEEARRRGARTILLTFNPASKFRLAGPRFLRLALATGPEAITGSTRLKAGTATKLVLNMFSTVAMIRLGKVRGNLMVDLDPSCEKLHDRAARILAALHKIPQAEAWRRLERHDWKLKALLSARPSRAQGRAGKD